MMAVGLADDMRQAFALLQSGVYPNLVGVTGSWDFDEEKYTSVLHSTYAHWSYTPEDGFHTWDYLSTDGSRRTSSTLAGWNWAASRMESFDENAIEPHILPYGIIGAFWWRLPKVGRITVIRRMCMPCTS